VSEADVTEQFACVHACTAARHFSESTWLQLLATGWIEGGDLKSVYKAHSACPSAFNPSVRHSACHHSLESADTQTPVRESESVCVRVCVCVCERESERVAQSPPLHERVCVCVLCVCVYMLHTLSPCTSTCIDVCVHVHSGHACMHALSLFTFSRCFLYLSSLYPLLSSLFLLSFLTLSLTHAHTHAHTASLCMHACMYAPGPHTRLPSLPPAALHLTRPGCIPQHSFLGNSPPFFESPAARATTCTGKHYISDMSLRASSSSTLLDYGTDGSLAAWQG
jgi:hypothetical protein